MNNAIEQVNETGFNAVSEPEDDAKASEVTTLKCGEDREICDNESLPNDDDDSKRWSYFLVRETAHEFSSKSELKKWLQEYGIGTFMIIRGRIIPTNEKIRRVVTIG